MNQSRYLGWSCFALHYQIFSKWSHSAVYSPQTIALAKPSAIDGESVLEFRAVMLPLFEHGSVSYQCPVACETSPLSPFTNSDLICKLPRDPDSIYHEDGRLALFCDYEVLRCLILGCVRLTRFLRSEDQMRRISPQMPRPLEDFLLRSKTSQSSLHFSRC